MLSSSSLEKLSEVLAKQITDSIKYQAKVLSITPIHPFYMKDLDEA